ncbi:hypothetical protein ABW21_db0204504 [Orbilia brochopaga]|nr:hypothetical protein ABW21_db0204504 [Drechslerella brochopaga]
MAQKRCSNTAADNSVEQDFKKCWDDFIEPDAGAKTPTTSASVLTTTAKSDVGGPNGPKLLETLFSKCTEDGRPQVRKHLAATSGHSGIATKDRNRSCPRVGSIPELTVPKNQSAILARSRFQRRPSSRLHMPVHRKQLVKAALRHKGRPVPQNRPARGKSHDSSKKSVALKAHVGSVAVHLNTDGVGQMDDGGPGKQETPPTESSQSTSPPRAPPRQRNRRKPNPKKGQRKISGNDGGSDDEDEHQPESSTSKGPSNQQSPARYHFACPFFKADPSAHMQCRDMGCSEKRKIKEHLKRNHYKDTKLPPEIQDTHNWNEWYQYIVKDTDKETRLVPTPEANFAGVVLLLTRASQKLEDQEAPCFGTRMLKLLQHAQRNPTEVDKIVQELAAILGGPAASSYSAFQADLFSVQPPIDHPVLDQFDGQGNPLAPFPCLESTPVAINSICRPLESNNSPFFPVNQATTNSYKFLLPLETGDFLPTPMVTRADPQFDATHGIISEWICSNTGQYISHEAIDDSATAQQTGCQTKNIAAQNWPNLTSYAQKPITAICTETALDQVTNDYVGPRNLTNSNILSNITSGLVSSDHIQATPFAVNATADNAMPAPPSFPCRPNNGFSKNRKRLRAGSMDNITIYNPRACPLPTPSPSVCERPPHSAQWMTPLLTPLTTPFTPSTSCGVSASSKMILVTYDLRPEVFRFEGSISDHIDDFVNWTIENFAFDFRSFQGQDSIPINQCHFMNSSEGIIVPCNRENELRTHLNSFWGDILYSRSIPWFWIHMPSYSTSFHEPNGFNAVLQ